MMTATRLRLREVRERLLVTQQELAERAGVTRSNISRLENGLQRPQITTVRKLAAALGVEPDELIDWGPRRRPRRKPPVGVTCDGFGPPPGWELRSPGAAEDDHNESRAAGR